MNRLGLDLWSLALDDDDFARAVAAAGAVEAVGIGRPAQPPKTQDDAQILWSIDSALAVLASGDAAPMAAHLRANILGEDERVQWALPDRVLGGAVTPEHFVALWQAMLSPSFPPPRLRIDGEPDATLAGFAQWLQRPAVGAQTVSLQSFEAADGQVDWQLPFTLATLKQDPLGPHLEQIQANVPPGWPYRFAAIDRTLERPEVLLIGTGVADALAALLSNRVRIKCSLIVIAGWGDDDLSSALPLLRTLVVRLRADGIAVLPVTNGLAHFAQQLRWLGDQLAHDEALDTAITAVFGAQALLLASDDLLHLSRMTRAIDDLQTRLRNLPGNAGIALSPAAVNWLQIEPSVLYPQRTGQHSQARVQSSWQDRIQWVDDVFKTTGRGTTIVRDAVRAARREAERSGAAPPPRSMPPPSLPSGAAPELVAPAPKLSEELARTRDKFAFGAESAEASALTEVVEQVRAQEVVPALLTPRYIQQRSFTADSGPDRAEARGFVVGEAVSVHVRIGPAAMAAGWTVATEVFPDQALPKDRAVHPLRLLFHEARQLDQPLLGSLRLPSTGTSDEARFTFTPRAEGPFEARITLLHKNRVLQTALLRTTVAATRDALPADGSLALDIEVEVRRNLAELGTRQRFDLAMVLNHTAAGQRRLTALAGRRAWAADLSGIDDLVDRINALISTVANDTKGYDKGLDKGKNPVLLIRLARLGRNLYTVLDPHGEGALVSDGLDLADDRITHIQVISTRMDEVVPIEFMYDYPAPATEGAKVCPKHREALSAGRCPTDCDGRKKPTAHVCPMGFWGVRKVIERHAYNPRLKNPDGADLVLQAEPVGDRDRLAWRSASVLGHSQRVTRASVDGVAARLAVALDAKKVTVATHWSDWKKLVKKHQPGLLIAFPHNSGKHEEVQLEIGDVQLPTFDLDAAYVTDRPDVSPIVFLLGCDTAGTAESFSGHVRFFRRAGAAVVVSTIATVFGAHAVKVGDEIVRALLAPRTGDDERLGEVLREAKRQALLASVPMALCVVAFGDADWKL